MSETVSWREHWSTQTHGGHRSQSEEFLRRESEEKLFHLGRGGSLLDFGCGSADLLVYYRQRFDRVTGVDFSPSMLEAARARVEAWGAGDIQLIQADDSNVWERVSGSFDRVTAGQVVQYLDLGQIERFLAGARGRLTEGGYVVFFDVIDPRIYLLHELGLFEEGRATPRATHALRLLIGKTLQQLRGRSAAIGYRYRPEQIRAVAERQGFRMELAWSMYYEYRYHCILVPR